MLMKSIKDRPQIDTCDPATACRKLADNFVGLSGLLGQ